jgi:hypothetical protein
MIWRRSADSFAFGRRQKNRTRQRWSKVLLYKVANQQAAFVSGALERWSQSHSTDVIRIVNLDLYVFFPCVFPSGYWRIYWHNFWYTRINLQANNQRLKMQPWLWCRMSWSGWLLRSWAYHVGLSACLLRQKERSRIKTARWIYRKANVWKATIT